MVDEKKQVTTAERLARNLGLLRAGSTVTLEIVTPAGQRGRYRTVFIGYLPKKYVLVQYPDLNKVGNFAVHIKSGVKVTVRGIEEGHEGAVVAFQSNIKQVVSHPSRMIALEFPQEVGLQTLRHCIRIDTEIKAAAIINNKKWRALITDLSVGGCQLYIENGEQLALVADGEIKLLIEHHHELDTLAFNVEICNIKQLANAVSVGVKFKFESKAKVEQLLLSTMANEE